MGRAAHLTMNVSNVPNLTGGIGQPVVLGPEEVFDTPQLVWLPLPKGTNVAEVDVYYYHNDGDAAGWYPGEEVKGWLAEDSFLHLEANGTSYLGFVARHGALVQLGINP
jgi:hypothetical protein